MSIVDGGVPEVGAPADVAGEPRGEDTSSAAADQPQVFDFRKPSARDAVVESAWELVCPVFFVGFMGAGKTSVARKLARRAGVASIDMDTYIARRYDRKPAEFFAESGEKAFREVESQVLKELAASEPLLVSCGGGVVLSERNREIMKRNGFVVYLMVTPEEAASRISDLATRPLFGDLDQARCVIQERLPLYAEVADLVLDTSGCGTGWVAREAFSRLASAGVLVKRP